MGMFKYSSEVVPTQTLQLNTKTVCLYVFETHNLKLPSAEQEAILSSCKNNSSRFFFPLPCWDEFDKLQSLFGKVWNTSTPCSHSQWLEHATGRCKKLKDVSGGFPHPHICPLHSAEAAAALQSGNFCFFLSPLKPAHTLLLTVFKLHVLLELKRRFYSVGRH